ncbi:MAG: BrnA antitoxin family protein [gamma proteobacterium symbiont of Bathyaustriella thionipta]|nr:BrnA antitoxin family protein [gamma proteobacterium symbiont of Bathyaustriella thionipta]
MKTRQTDIDIQANLKELATLADDQIDTSDQPEIQDFSRAQIGKFYRPVKQQVTLRLDADLLAWFRGQGGKYQTKINAALREFMESHAKMR